MSVTRHALLPVLCSAAVVSLAGCWKPSAELTELTFDEVPFDHPDVVSSTVVISAFDSTLDCPNGEDARFFAVYDTAQVETAPVAIVLHSGAFDYVVEPEPGNALAGRTYRGISRLDRGWAISKVWETLGLYYDVVDPYEENTGTLAAALANRGFVQLHPSNCWGDMWHNEQGYQDNQSDVEGFDRNGRTFAYWMIRMIAEQSFAGDQGFVVPLQLSAQDIYLFGLGDGGRGVREVLTHENLLPIKGALVDSAPDDLTAYQADEEVWADELAGFSRIFREENMESLDQYTLAGLAESGELPERTAFIWSDGDPRLPVASLENTAAALSGADDVWVSNRREPGHVFVNNDYELADAAIEYLVSGTIPPADVGGGDDPQDSGL